MSSADPREFRESRPLPLLWWTGLILLFIAEVLILSGLFNHSAVPSTGGFVWTRLISLGGWIVRPAVAAVAATALVGWIRLRDELQRQLGGVIVPPGRTVALVLFHLAALSGFAWLTSRVQSGELQSSPFSHNGGLSPGWALRSRRSVFGPARAIPFKLWGTLLRHGGSTVLLLGGFVGVLAVEAAKKASDLWEHDWGNALNTTTTGSVYWVLRLISTSLVYDPKDWTVGTRSFAVKVHGPCSGVEGMALILVFLVAYLAIFRRACRFPHAFLLLATGLCPDVAGEYRAHRRADLHWLVRLSICGR